MNDAITLDPKLPWPHRALAYRKMCTADWQGARKDWDQAMKLGADRNEARNYEMILQLATGKAGELEASLRKKLEQEPENVLTAVHLADVLASQGKENEAAEPFDRATVALRQKYGAGNEKMLRQMRSAVLYYSGKMRE